MLSIKFYNKIFSRFTKQLFPTFLVIGFLTIKHYFVGSPDDKTKLMFDMYDFDHSGKLSRQEFSEMIR